MSYSIYQYYLSINNDFLDRTVTPDNIVIFSDSLSVLLAVKDRSSTDITNILSEVQRINSHGAHVTLQWVPGHSGIPGNEVADQLSKTGASMPQTNTAASLRTCRGILRAKSKERWLNDWANAETGRPLYRFMDKPDPKDPANLLCRGDQTLIFRARTGHLQTNKHINRINPMWLPHCRHCDHHEESVEHLLLHCPSLATLRLQLLPTPPDIKTTLYTDHIQMMRTCSFLREAMRCQEQTARS